uniref:MPN domain-containing protein n=1 Tax=Chromera velia CCMP2878 TaxID=1169474 RepID=A0A0G4HYF9_9ALVE|eukprot:Cvel_9499.t1-p1 / transcript=Cvel_9499.t1 / gene=Cvel_9499 / organism=Chromera_velia_CCMP2878 / gene_product=Lys-63-specific deubiquitinase BRCC36, putative / transcript_product=Lys-63-specific deubiquitinase BRCC36, putative / location=Cvel_scaffold549:21078-25786(+) / protein_length=428 / sequence_SO=supercontig / SO=protein_coding / is_pseudo=false
MLKRVRISSDAYRACLSHALTTDNEEIMGLLIGDVTLEGGPSSSSSSSVASPADQISLIWAIKTMKRSDKSPDRVEISAEQLYECSEHAEKISKLTGRKSRVVGWYHSHPHITVLPSHVDVHTQASYQRLDPGFVGLIFSCFNTTTSTSKSSPSVPPGDNKNKGGRLPDLPPTPSHGEVDFEGTGAIDMHGGFGDADSEWETNLNRFRFDEGKTEGGEGLVGDGSLRGVSAIKPSASRIGKVQVIAFQAVQGSSGEGLGGAGGGVSPVGAGGGQRMDRLNSLASAERAQLAVMMAEGGGGSGGGLTRVEIPVEVVPSLEIFPLQGATGLLAMREFDAWQMALEVQDILLKELEENVKDGYDENPSTRRQDPLRNAAVASKYSFLLASLIDRHAAPLHMSFEDVSRNRKVIQKLLKWANERLKTVRDCM